MTETIDSILKKKGHGIYSGATVPDAITIVRELVQGMVDFRGRPLPESEG